MLSLFLAFPFSCVVVAAAQAPQQFTRTGALAAHEIKAIEQVIGYSFHNKTLLTDAFCHNSLMASGFQQLEFLGDRIIASILADYDFSLTCKTETLHEKLKSKTNNVYLARRFKELGLTEFLKTNPSSNQNTIAADAFEALVGAIQIDSEENKGVLSSQTVDFVLRHLNGIKTQKESVLMQHVTVTVTKASGDVLCEIGVAHNPKTAKLQAVKKLWPQLFLTDGFSTKTITWKPFADGCKTLGYSIRYDATSVQVPIQSSSSSTAQTRCQEKELQPSFSYPAADGRAIIFVHEGVEHRLKLSETHGVPPLEVDFTDRYIAGMDEGRLRQTIDKLKEDREYIQCCGPYYAVESTHECGLERKCFFSWNKQEIKTADEIIARLEDALVTREKGRDRSQDIRYPAAIGYGEILIRNGRRFFLDSRKTPRGMPPAILDFSDGKVAQMTRDALSQTVAYLQQKTEDSQPYGLTGVEHKRHEWFLSSAGISLPWSPEEIARTKLILLRLEQEVDKRAKQAREEEWRRQWLVQQQEKKEELLRQQSKRMTAQQPKGWCAQS